MNKRYVVFSDEKGVFLTVHNGRPVWSLKEPQEGTDAALTFSGQEEFDNFIRGAQLTEDLHPYRLVEMTSDLPGNRASKEAIANRALPIW
jgi:hypothetical protein